MPGRKRRLPIKWTEQKRQATQNSDEEIHCIDYKDEVIEVQSDNEEDVSIGDETIQEDSGVFDDTGSSSSKDNDNHEEKNMKPINKCVNIPTLFEEQTFNLGIYQFKKWERLDRPDEYTTLGCEFDVRKSEVTADKYMFVGYLKLDHQPDDQPGNAIGQPFHYSNQSKVSKPFGVIRCGNLRDVSKRHLETYFILESIHNKDGQTAFTKGNRKAAEELFYAIGTLRNSDLLILDLRYIPDNQTSDKHIIMDIYLNSKLVFKESISDPLDSAVSNSFSKLRRNANSFMLLFKHLNLSYEESPCQQSNTKKQSTSSELYNNLKSYHLENENRYSIAQIERNNIIAKNDSAQLQHSIVSTNGDVQHTSLLPILYPYQCQAVRWMLFRETINPDSNDVNVIWKKIKTIDGQEFFFNCYVGRLSKECPTSTLSPTGGILADEMGLGKTIEVLACILNNPKPTPKVIAQTENEVLGIEELNHTDGSTNCRASTNLDNHDEDIIMSSDKAKTVLSNENEQVNVLDRKDSTETSNSKSLQKPGEDVIIITDNNEISASNSSNLPNTKQEADKPTKESLDACYSECKPESKTIKVVTHKVNNPKDNTWLQKAKKCDIHLDLCSVCSSQRAKLAEDVLLYCIDCARPIHESCAGLINNEAIDVKCPQCAANEMIPSHATLIVAPAAIVHQWTDEIKKHVKGNSLKVKVYHGVSKEYLQPFILASYDIVITTYQILRTDLHYVLANEAKRKLRGQRKYIVLPSPLISIDFWRLCFDEAQMVEDQTSRTAEMAFKINAVHRWCVTGTPLPSGLNSTLGLFSNIGLFPYFRRFWWHKLLMAPIYHLNNTQPLFDAISKYMWRVSMKDVADQIDIPQQNEIVHWVSFGPAEQHLYIREQDQLSQSAFKELNRHSMNCTLQNIGHRTLSTIMNPLLRLRQACCHPQIVSGNTLGIGKKMVTMDTLIDGLISKTRIESIETHRQIIANYNGMAGIFQLLKQYEDAAKCYREAVGSWENQSDLATDSIQISSMREGYILKANGACQDSYINYADMLLATAESKDKVDFVDTPWYFVVIDNCIRLGLDINLDLYSRVLETIPSNHARDSGDRFKTWLRDFESVKRAVMVTMLELEEKRKTTVDCFKRLYTTPPPHIVDSAADCCLRPADGIPKRSCPICLLESQLCEYEAHVYNIESDSTNSTVGLRPESACNRVIRLLQGLTRHQYACHGVDKIQEQSQLHIKYFEQIKKEFKIFRESWIALRARVAAYDELDICTIKMRLLQPDEALSNDANVFREYELRPNLISLEHNGTALKQELHSKLGHLTYLKNLLKSERGNASKNEEPCPVCCVELGSQWSVFECGHCVCSGCSLRLKEDAARYNRRTIRCPICRAVTYYHKVYQVATRKHVQYQGDGIEIKGHYSAKIDAVLRSVLGILRDDCTAKLVVFSAWESILKLLVTAFEQHEINHRYTFGGMKKFNLSVDEFKAEPSVSVLLMPLLSGSKGLNLVQANHVLLVEPSLNPSNEQQAIGRIHRIGQTRSTWVHRFLIRGTVEERIFKLAPSKPSSTSDQDMNYKLTLAEVGLLFAQSDEQD